MTCIGAIVGIKPPLLEVSQLVTPSQPPVGVTKSALSGDSALFRAEDAASLLYPSYMNQKESVSAEEKLNILKPNVIPDEIDNTALLSTPNYNENRVTDPSASNTLQKDNVSSDSFKESGPSKPLGFAESIQTDGLTGYPLHAVDSDSSCQVTPVLSCLSGLQTPVLTDQMLQAHARDTSWLIKLCMKNIIGKLSFHLFYYNYLQ